MSRYLQEQILIAINEFESSLNTFPTVYQISEAIEHGVTSVSMNMRHVVNDGLVTRHTERTGPWVYSLTAKGLEALRSKEVA